MTRSINLNFVHVLECAMANKDWKAIQLAAALCDQGVDTQAQTVERWLTGGTEPRLSTARAIADIFEITLGDLYPKK